MTRTTTTATKQAAAAAVAEVEVAVAVTGSRESRSSDYYNSNTTSSSDRGGETSFDEDDDSSSQQQLSDDDWDSHDNSGSSCHDDNNDDTTDTSIQNERQSLIDDSTNMSTITAVTPPTTITTTDTYTFDPIIEPQVNNHHRSQRTNSTSRTPSSSLLSSIAAKVIRQRRPTTHPQPKQHYSDFDNTAKATTTSASTNRHSIRGVMIATTTANSHDDRRLLSKSKQQQQQRPRYNNNNTTSSSRHHRRFGSSAWWWNFWNIHHGRNHKSSLLPHNNNNINNAITTTTSSTTNHKRTKKRHRLSSSSSSTASLSFYETMNTYATYLLCISLVVWVFVVFIWNTDTTADNDENHSIHRNDLTIRERTRMRSRNHNNNRSNHHPQRQSRNYLVQLGHYINSLVFGTSYNPTFPANGTDPVMIDSNINNHDLEDVPKECTSSEWQSYNYPSCNDIYEIDLPNMIRLADQNNNQKYYMDDEIDFSDNNNITHTGTNGIPYHQHPNSSPIGFVAQGFWRSVWAVHPPRRAVVGTAKKRRDGNDEKYEPNVVVLKTMRRTHDITFRNYERHRRDAIVMEQLTSSPYVMDMYSFCGNSVLTEYMDTTLEDVAFDASQDATMNIQSKSVPITSERRIQLALDMVRGVEAIHTIPGGPIVHADIQAKQFLISSQTGTVKINDFNRCRFMSSKQEHTTTAINHTTSRSSRGGMNETTRTTTPCKFRIPSSPGTSRSPEEYMDGELDEKIDIYAVGHVLYNLLSYREAWSGYHTHSAQQRMIDGEIPNMDATSNHTTNLFALSDVPNHIQEWYINVTKRAYTYDPSERMSATEVALELEAMLHEIQQQQG